MLEHPSFRAGAKYARALILIAIAGATDAVGFLHFRTFYVSFMSGNTTQVAVALAKAQRENMEVGAGIIAAFVLGVIVGELLSGGLRPKAGFTLLLEAATLLGTATLASAQAASFAMAFAMGLHNSLLLKAGRIGVALTYVTGTLVHLGRGVACALARRPDRKPIWPFAAEWGALLAGAVVGAAARQGGEATALVGLSALLVMTAALPGGVLEGVKR